MKSEAIKYFLQMRQRRILLNRPYRDYTVSPSVLRQHDHPILYASSNIFDINFFAPDFHFTRCLGTPIQRESASLQFFQRPLIRQTLLFHLFLHESLYPYTRLYCLDHVPLENSLLSQLPPLERYWLHFRPTIRDITFSIFSSSFG